MPFWPIFNSVIFAKNTCLENTFIKWRFLFSIEAHSIPRAWGNFFCILKHILRRLSLEIILNNFLWIFQKILRVKVLGTRSWSGFFSFPSKSIVALKCGNFFCIVITDFEMTFEVVLNNFLFGNFFQKFCRIVLKYSCLKNLN